MPEKRYYRVPKDCVRYIIKSKNLTEHYFKKVFFKSLIQSGGADSRAAYSVVGSSLTCLFVQLTISSHLNAYLLINECTVRYNKLDMDFICSV